MTNLKRGRACAVGFIAGGHSSRLGDRTHRATPYKALPDGEGRLEGEASQRTSPLVKRVDRIDCLRRTQDAAP